jgi:hypothetical protein
VLESLGAPKPTPYKYTRPKSMRELNGPVNDRSGGLRTRTLSVCGYKRSADIHE